MNFKGHRQYQHRHSQYNVNDDHRKYVEQNLQQQDPFNSNESQHSSRFLGYNVTPSTRPLPSSSRQRTRHHVEKRTSATLLTKRGSFYLPTAENDLISQLPFELILQIIQHLDLHSMLILGLVSRRWRSFSLIGEEWHRRMQQQGWKFHLPNYLQPYVSLDRIDWRYWYIQRYRLEQRWKLGRVNASFLSDHKDGVYCLQFDDRKIISGSRDRTIKIWDAVSFQCVRTLVGHEGSVLCLHYNQDYLVTGSSDATVIVWCMRELKQLTRIRGHTAKISEICFNDDYLISGSRDHTIRITRMKTWELVRVIPAHDGHINAIKLHGSHLLSASKDRTLRLWDIETGQLLQEYVGHDDAVSCAAFDGTTIVSGSLDKTIKIWNAQTGECLRTLEGHLGLVRALSFSQGRIVSAGYDQSIRVWDADTGECLLNYQDGHTAWVFDVKFDEKRIVSASQDRNILVMDFANGLDTRCIC
ncbi:WD40 repeat-like protein [Hesseltinella vesiculosa]|uniref:WD40 repeat-like protein n=1 Tax=Hesseltinella vesiculosa TaxID=101127 RepID=A0A1X2GSL3_9FUNG|nr:WD40 repeat-like protein [Hesseltinella vesiculosa]